MFTKEETHKRLRKLTKEARELNELPSNARAEVAVHDSIVSTEPPQDPPQEETPPTIPLAESPAAVHGAIVYLRFAGNVVETGWLGTPDHEPKLLYKDRSEPMVVQVIGPNMAMMVDQLNVDGELILLGKFYRYSFPDSATPRVIKTFAQAAFRSGATGKEKRAALDLFERNVREARERGWNVNDETGAVSR